MTSCQAGSKSSDNTAEAATDNNSTDQTTMSTDTNNVKVEISTTMGDITVMLYGDTPKHRDNFVKLAKEGFYDGTLFHRVINEFMVQAGDPDSKTAKPGQQLRIGRPRLYPRSRNKIPCPLPQARSTRSRPHK